MIEDEDVRAPRRLLRRLFGRTHIQAPDQCWEWLGCRTEDGYGRIRVGDRIERTHRLSFRLLCGDIGAGDVVRHACDCRACVNPNHLLLGTKKDNTKDMLERGRHRSGSAKLEPAQVIDIRERLAIGTPRSVVAEEFGLSADHVRRIEKNEVWRDLEAEDGTDPDALRYNEVIPF